MEKIKSLLIIIFIVGIIGAVNTVIAQSRSGESIFTAISRVLGFYQEKPKEAGRSLDYVPGKLKAEENSQATQQVAPPTASNTSGQNLASPSPTPAAIQTAPPIPQIRPFSSTLGVSTEAPPIPKIKPFTKEVLGTRTEVPFEKQIIDLFKTTADYLGL